MARVPNVHKYAIFVNCIKVYRSSFLTTDKLITTGLALRVAGPRIVFFGGDVPIARCKTCSVIIEQQPNGSWKHRTSNGIGTQNPCNNPEIGIGLHELIQIYWRQPRLYSSWAHQSQTSPYSPNCILSALQFQATIHWNNCGNSCDRRCITAAKQHADGYMAERMNGRRDLHPTEDQEVHTLAFKIHNQRIAEGTHTPRAQTGVMTCSYVVGTGTNAACDCYERGYTRWVLETKQLLEHKMIAMTKVDPDDMHYESRYE